MFVRLFPQLDVLQVSGIAMKRLDERMQRLRDLQTLNVADNLLTALPDTPGHWTKLSTLDLTSNKFTTVPPLLYK
jgi:Leucine-rich repeat (LRR) protein